MPLVDAGLETNLGLQIMLRPIATLSSAIIATNFLLAYGSPVTMKQSFG